MSMFLKKSVIIVFVILCVFISTLDVYAKVLTVDDLTQSFSKSSIIEAVQQITNDNYSLKIDSENNILELYQNEEKVLSVDYNSEFIEYVTKDNEVTQDNLDNNFNDAIWMMAILETVFIASGYEDKFIESDSEFENTYELYGIEMETEDYNFSGKDENSEWSTKGTYLKRLKISLDTDKIDRLISTYGTDKTESIVDDEGTEEITGVEETTNETNNSSEKPKSFTGLKIIKQANESTEQTDKNTENIKNNPNTGIKSSFLSLVLVILLAIILKLRNNKRNVFIKL